jgi:hypothetical protein
MRLGMQMPSRALGVAVMATPGACT